MEKLHFDDFFFIIKIAKIGKKNRKKFVKLYLHSIYTAQSSLHFNEFFNFF